jgi:hypothetical protein
VAQAQHAELGKERERLQAALTQRHLASTVADVAVPDASAEAILEAVSSPNSLTHTTSALMPGNCSSHARNAAHQISQ